MLIVYHTYRPLARLTLFTVAAASLVLAMFFSFSSRLLILGS
jgi:hypothetical protein